MGSAKISSLYGPYYFAYLESVQDPAITTKLVMAPPSPDTEGDCYSHYTIVRHSEEGGYSTVSFAEHFRDVLAPILSEMDALVSRLQTVSAATASTEELKVEHASYIAFFQQYRLCHSSEVNAEELEEMWSELDRKWMDMKVRVTSKAVMVKMSDACFSFLSNSSQHSPCHSDGVQPSLTMSFCRATSKWSTTLRPDTATPFV